MQLLAHIVLMYPKRRGLPKRHKSAVDEEAVNGKEKKKSPA
jgi:hypothetical protein